MSRQPISPEYEQPSCMRENMLSVWIWMRESLDVELRNRTTAMIAENNLISVRDNMEKNKDKIVCDRERATSDLMKKARLCKSSPKEQQKTQLKKLIPLLHSVKGIQKREMLVTNQLKLLDVQIDAFENGRCQREMTETLRAGVVAMKKVGIQDDASDMDNIVLDMEDSLIEHSKFADSMSLSLVNSMDDTDTDEGLMRELMAMIGDENDNDEKKDVPIQSRTEPTIVTVQPVVETLPIVATKPTVDLPPLPMSITKHTTDEESASTVKVGVSEQEYIEDSKIGQMQDVELLS